MSAARGPYDTVILDHNRHPRNYGELDGATASAEGHNRLCGDAIRVAVRIENGVVTAAAFTGQSCAIAKAAASVMTMVVQDRPVNAIQTEAALFERLISGDPLTQTEEDRLGMLMGFASLRDFPVRTKCALLPWHALLEALDKTPSPHANEAGT
jgi:nitrogen fixation NifU-like protein